MEVIYLYLALSYLFMIAPCLKDVDEQPVAVTVQFIFSPVVLPVVLGFIFADRYRPD